MAELRVARSELILGGNNSGKTARAEALSAVWLDASPQHRAVYIATAQAWDEEMRGRIDRQRRERASGVARMAMVEEPTELAHAIGVNSRADTLIVVDCLTLWLTARLMWGESPHPHPNPPPAGEGTHSAPPDADALSLRGRAGVGAPGATIADALGRCAGPLILISNEIETNAAPTRDSAAFLQSLGTLIQQAAASCERVTFMSAGRALLLKGQP